MENKRSYAIEVLSPGKVQFKGVDLERAAPQQVLVEALYSAISAGTELLYYRGQAPTSTDIRDSFQHSTYPMPLGYATVGIIRDLGSDLDRELLGRRVFCLAPHASMLLVERNLCFLIPSEISDACALFYANAETAVTLALDSAARLGERCAVWGLGVVGGLTAALMQQFPLSALYLFDPDPFRRHAVTDLLNVETHDVPSERPLVSLSLDLSLEISGQSTALAAALDHAAYTGRIVIGSWYGNQKVELPLGGAFHRQRISITSSQVSSIDPLLQGRFDRARRTDLVWQLLRSRPFEQWISHRFAFAEAKAVYEHLATRPKGLMQAIFVHSLPPE